MRTFDSFFAATDDCPRPLTVGDLEKIFSTLPKDTPIVYNYDTGNSFPFFYFWYLQDFQMAEEGGGAKIALVLDSYPRDPKDFY